MQSLSASSLPIMGLKDRRTYIVLLSLGVCITTLFGIFWFQPHNLPKNFSGSFHVIDFFIFAIVSYIVWYPIINNIFTWYITGHMKRPVYITPKTGMRVALLTAFVPSSEPIEMLKNTLTAMVSCQYPHDTWLLDEGADPHAKNLCRKLGVHYFSRKGMAKYNTPEGPYKTKSKGGNYNAWFDRFGKNYDVVAQMDVDFVPKKTYLTRVLGYFRDPKVAFVGTPQVYGNTSESWITKGAAQQAYAFYGSIQKGLHGAGMSLFIGANHAVRVAAHNDIEGYAGHVVEDHLTGMKLYAKRWKSIYVPEILAVGEGPVSWRSYFSQQMRWAYGLIDILLFHSPKVLPKMPFGHILNYFLLQQYYFYGLTQALGLLLMIGYFFFGIESTPVAIVPLLLAYVPVLLFESLFFIWSQRFNIEPKKEQGFMWHAKLLNLAVWPIYIMALISVLVRKRITYVVTPKGSIQRSVPDLRVLSPHVAIALASGTCLVGAFVYDRYSPLLVFWCVLLLSSMSGFVISEALKYGAPIRQWSIWNYQMIPLYIRRASLAYIVVVAVVYALSAYINATSLASAVVISPIPEEIHTQDTESLSLGRIDLSDPK